MAQYTHTTYKKFFKDKDQWDHTKSVMRALRIRKWHTEFLEFLGDECDFTSVDLDKDELLGNLHSAILVIKKSVKYVQTEDLKLIFFELLRFMIPLGPPLNHSARRH